MDETLLLLAIEAFGEISSVEAALLHAVEVGREAVAAAGFPIVRAAVVEWLCTYEAPRPRIRRHGVALNGFTVSGFLDLIHADVPFPLQFHNCRFDKQIWFKSIRLRSLSFKGSHLHGLNADSALIQTNVLMIEGFETDGEVAFRGAIIGGDFRTDGANYRGTNSSALVCDRIKVSGGVFLSRNGAPSTFDGEVRFAGAQVGGNFQCEGAILRNPGGIAFCGERLTTGGTLDLGGSQGFGEFNLAASKTGVDLNCRGVKLTSTAERTFNAERASIAAHVLLDGGFTCDRVHFLAINIQEGLRCRAAKIGKLDLRYARVHGPFEWTEMVEPSESSIDFREAKLESIKDDQLSWPRPGAIQFDGLRFERFSETNTAVRDRLRWLRLDTSSSAQPYRQLSYVYEQSGRRDFARQVLFAFEELARARDDRPIAKLWNLLLRWTIGFGYQLWRAAVLMLLLTLVGFAVAIGGYRTKLIAPTDKDANQYFISTNRTPTQYPRFSASMYSIEHSLPVINLGVASSWSANTTAQWPRHRAMEPIIRFWFWLQTLFGWLLSIFFVAGLSGVVKTPK